MTCDLEHLERIWPARESALLCEARKEAEKHRWLESEKAGRDLGQEAVLDWSRHYWRYWYRERWIEHLAGERFWAELDRDDFGLLDREFHPNTELVAFVVERIRRGGENLDIIQEALNCNHPADELLEILRLLDINSRRPTFPA